jgi:hypothetical protein
VRSGKGEALEETGGVFLIAAEPIERFSKNDINLLAQGHADHFLEPRPKQRRARHRVIRVLALDVPALALCEFAADAELISD